jgi:hypothetical protein
VVAVEVVVVVVGVLVVVVVVVVGVVVVVVGVLVVVVVVLLEVVLLDVALVVWFWQSFAARSATVDAPCSRFLVSVALTDPGRLLTSALNALMALVAASHWPASIAEETRSS